jgi:hypothetical protein
MDPNDPHDRNHNSEGISPDSFYGNPEGNDKHYSSAAYYTDARNHNVLVSFADGISRPDISKQLMLYRRPSPWGTPPETIPSTGGTAKRAREGQEVVAVERGKARVAALEKLQGVAVRRRQTTDSKTIPTSATNESRGQKRNPFARRVSGLPSHDRAGTSDALACSPPSPFRQTRP